VKFSNVTNDLSMISPEQSTTNDFGVGEKLGPGVGFLVGVGLLLGILLGDELGLELG